STEFDRGPMTAFLETFAALFQSQTWRGVALQWAATLLLTLVTWGVLGFIERLAVQRLRRLAERPRLSGLSRIAELLDQTTFFLYAALGALLGRELFPFPATSERILWTGAVGFLFLQVGLWASRSVGLALDRYQEGLDDPREHHAVLSFLAFVGRVLVWTVVVLLVLENVGFDVTTLIAGLGVGGIAIALAAQNVLGDLFASLSLVVDKPFVPGDFIIVDDLMGEVERIGLKTTRIRSLGGEQLIFSNADLLNTRVRNYQRLEERRVNFQFGVVYQTDSETVAEIPDLVREIVESTEGVRFDRAHLKDFGDSAFRYEVIYWVLDPEYATYMDLQQEVLLEILDAFRERGIDLAYPTQTVQVDDPRGTLRRAE
ncbi:MAG: mechanosensitive ion channel family protein, partial [Bradymonadaceae bacterium]